MILSTLEPVEPVVDELKQRVLAMSFTDLLDDYLWYRSNSSEAITEYVKNELNARVAGNSRTRAMLDDVNWMHVPIGGGR